MFARKSTAHLRRVKMKPLLAGITTNRSSRLNCQSSCKSMCAKWSTYQMENPFLKRQTSCKKHRMTQEREKRSEKAMNDGDGGGVGGGGEVPGVGPPLSPLDWKFSQVFGERAAGEEVQEIHGVEFFVLEIILGKIQGESLYLRVQVLCHLSRISETRVGHHQVIILSKPH